MLGGPEILSPSESVGGNFWAEIFCFHRCLFSFYRFKCWGLDQKFWAPQNRRKWAKLFCFQNVGGIRNSEPLKRWKLPISILSVGVSEILSPSESEKHSQFLGGSEFLSPSRHRWKQNVGGIRNSEPLRIGENSLFLNFQFCLKLERSVGGTRNSEPLRIGGNSRFRSVLSVGGIRNSEPLRIGQNWGARISFLFKVFSVGGIRNSEPLRIGENEPNRSGNGGIRNSMETERFRSVFSVSEILSPSESEKIANFVLGGSEILSPSESDFVQNSQNFCSVLNVGGIRNSEPLRNSGPSESDLKLPIWGDQNFCLKANFVLFPPMSGGSEILSPSESVEIADFQF